MDREAITQRTAWLADLRNQQTARLEAARKEQQEALASLERIEGARQDCEFWASQLDSHEKAAEQRARDFAEVAEEERSLRGAD